MTQKTASLWFRKRLPDLRYQRASIASVGRNVIVVSAGSSGAIFDLVRLCNLLLKARSLPKDEFKREVEKELSGR
jgi:hypothetical protein